jgi:hypothetical protein
VRIRSVFAHSAQAVVEGALVSLLVVALMAGTAFAAKPAAGTGGHKGGGGTGSSATLVATPTQLQGGVTYTVSGSGYQPDWVVAISVADPGCCAAFNIGSDSTGHISFTLTSGAAGTYAIKAYKYGSSTLLASTSVTVTN